MTEQIANFGHTTLAEDLDNSETVVTVTSGAVFPSSGNYRVNCEDELMLVTARSGNDLTVTRGIEGTTAAAHTQPAAVDAVLTAAGLTTIIEEEVSAISGLPSARAKRTSSDLVLNSTSWANLDTGLDLVVPAQVDDVLLLDLSMLYSLEAVYAFLDAATIVSGSPVNYVSGGGGASDQGVQSWVAENSGNDHGQGGGIQYKVVAGDISGGNVTLRLRYRTSAASNKTIFCSVANPFHWSVVNLKGSTSSQAIGYEFAYAEVTSSVTPITATSEATGTNIVSAPAVLFDGNTRVCVEFFCPEAATSGGTVLVIDLSDGGTEIGRMAIVGDSDTDHRAPVHARRYLTPSAGSHTYSIQAWKGGSTAGLDFGAGGSGNLMPGYIRITKA